LARPYRQLPGRRIGKAGSKLTVTAILLKVLALALKRFPDFNASIDLDSQEIVYKKFFNVGVGCGYASGLLVPVVKNGRAVPPGVEPGVATRGIRRLGGRAAVAKSLRGVGPGIGRGGRQRSGLKGEKGQTELAHLLPPLNLSPG
jgi:hypothetical protein